MCEERFLHEEKRYVVCFETRYPRNWIYVW